MNKKNGKNGDIDVVFDCTEADLKQMFLKILTLVG